MNKTPTLTVEEFRRMNGVGSNDTWEAQTVSVNPLTVWISIPGEMPSLNKWTRQHWAVTRRMLQEMTANMQTLKAAKKLPSFEKATLRVVHYFRTNRSRDQDNYTPKQLQDSLRKAGILADDNANVLRLMPVEFEVDKQRPRTEVYISEWEEESE